MSETFSLALEFSRLRRTISISSAARRIAVVGPSGVGKTTVLRAVAGLASDGIGTIHVLGESWQNSATGHRVPAWLRGVGWVPQDARLFPHATVAENLRWSPRGTDGGADRGADRGAEVIEALELGGLLERMPKSLSGGERQRVALGRALLSSPRLLLLDEPFAALDAALHARVRSWLARRIAALRIPILLASHDPADIAALAEHVHPLE